MSIRSWVNEHSALVSIVTLVILVGALVAILYNTMSGSSNTEIPNQRWYYDLTEKTAFADRVDRIAPFKTEAGHDAVEPIVFHCGSCSEPKQIAYLAKYTPQAAKLMEQELERMRERGQDTNAIYLRGPDGFGAPGDTQKVSRVDTIQWMNFMDPKALAMIKSSMKCPEGVQRVLECPAEE